GDGMVSMLDNDSAHVAFLDQLLNLVDELMALNLNRFPPGALCHKINSSKVSVLHQECSAASTNFGYFQCHSREDQFRENGHHFQYRSVYCPRGVCYEDMFGFCFCTVVGAFVGAAVQCCGSVRSSARTGTRPRLHLSGHSLPGLGTMLGRRRRSSQSRQSQCWRFIDSNIWPGTRCRV